jgi:hypothetical protein
VLRKIHAGLIVYAILACSLAGPAFGQAKESVRITLDEIQMALQHNHNLLAAPYDTL